MLANKWGRMEKGKVFGKGSKPLSDAEVKKQQAWAGEFIENVKPLLGKDELPSQYKKWVKKGKVVEELHFGPREAKSDINKKRKKSVKGKHAGKVQRVRGTSTTIDDSSSDDDERASKEVDTTILPPGMGLPKNTGRVAPPPLEEEEDGDVDGLEDSPGKENKRTRVPTAKIQAAAVEKIRAGQKKLKERSRQGNMNALSAPV